MAGPGLQNHVQSGPSVSSNQSSQPVGNTGTTNEDSKVRVDCGVDDVMDEWERRGGAIEEANQAELLFQLKTRSEEALPGSCHITVIPSSPPLSSCQ